MPEPKQNTTHFLQVPEQNLLASVPMVLTTSTTTFQAICIGHPSNTGAVMDWCAVILEHVKLRAAE